MFGHEDFRIRPSRWLNEHKDERPLSSFIVILILSLTASVLTGGETGHLLVRLSTDVQARLTFVPGNDGVTTQVTDSHLQRV